MFPSQHLVKKLSILFSPDNLREFAAKNQSHIREYENQRRLKALEKENARLEKYMAGLERNIVQLEKQITRLEKLIQDEREKTRLCRDANPRSRMSPASICTGMTTNPVSPVSSPLPDLIPDSDSDSARFRPLATSTSTSSTSNSLCLSTLLREPSPTHNSTNSTNVFTV